MTPAIKLRSSIFQHIVIERARQDGLWGFPQANSNPEWSTILTEEVGEVAQEVLRVRFGGKSEADLEMELIQVAAVCVSWIEHIRLRNSLEDTTDQ